MKARLVEIRATLDHGGDKGTLLEKTVREFLREYLPRRLEVGTGEIVDTKEHRSNQADIVIVNEDHPLTFTKDSPGLFFIEGVCAVGEVKTILTSDGLEKTLNNSAVFRQLESLPGTGTMVSTNQSDLQRFYKSPPFFLMAFESQLELPSILSGIQGFSNKKGFPANATNTILDVVYVLDKGEVINLGDGQGAYRMVIDEQGTLGKGWVLRNSEIVIFDLVGWLSSVMPKMVRYVPLLPNYLLPH